MALLLAPYNNGMRLGQGFNSYTQQIRIDDAVTVDADRIENFVTNDGFTMLELRSAMSSSPIQGEEGVTKSLPSAEGNEVASSAAIQNIISIELEQRAQDMKKLLEEIATLEGELEDMNSESPEAEKKTQTLRKKKLRLSQLKSQETLRQFSLVGTATSGANSKNLSQRAASQIVTYTSRFVNKLSEVTDDMNISGSLSIKYGAIGGSGKGSFIDSDKFKESDLNFYISVKVINQSINIKDALVYQPLPSVNETNFTEVFGDSFISGFLEGGEFNALVSMKVLNEDKRTEIAAEAKVALAIGPGEIKAEAKVGVAKSNIKANTETTIQVGWSGGGHVKPMDQPWTVESLMETAARFPDLVATTPQRTYAILTKYESLRSFMATKPSKLVPIMYENAAIYTNSLLDVFMDYKNIHRNISTDLFDLQAGTKVFDPSPDSRPVADSTTLSKIDDKSRFSADHEGLDLARRACRFQMMKIVNEVDTVTKNPKVATDEKRGEQFQSSISFRARLPKIFLARAPPKVALFGDDSKTYPPLLEAKPGLYLSQDETDKAASIVANHKEISENLRLAPLVGSDEGTLFCNIDYIKPSFSLLQVTVEVNEGAVTCMTTRYANGLVTSLGAPDKGTKVTFNVRPDQGEKIIACSIEVGHVVGQKDAAKDRVTAVRLYSNRGPDLLGNASDWKPAVDGKGVRGGVQYEGLTLTHFDPLLVQGHLKGFWGRSVNSAVRNKRTGLYRLAPIWGDLEDPSIAGGSSLDYDMAEAIDKPATLGEICAPSIRTQLAAREQQFVDNVENKRNYGNFRFDRGLGPDGPANQFNTATKLRELQAPSSAWPRGLEFYTAVWDNAVRVSKVRVIYDQGATVCGSENGNCSLFVPLFPDERVILIRLGNDLKKSTDKSIKFPDIGVTFVEVHTSTGKICRWGDANTNVQNIYPYDGSVGLKGFWGCYGDIIDRLCVIWGKP